MKLKSILTTVALVAALVLSQTAAADSRHHRRGFSNFGFGSHHNSYHFGSGFGYGNYYYGGRHHRDRHFSTGSFVGGLLLGSLINYPSYSRRSYDRYGRVRPAGEVVYVQKSTTRSNTTVATGRRLLRDLQGNCFERNIDEQGNEIRVQLEASECSF